MTVFKFKTSQMVNEGLFAFKPQKVSKIYDTLQEACRRNGRPISMCTLPLTLLC